MTDKNIERLRKKALRWVKKNPNGGILGPFISRSCWNCNPSHEHLKKADYPIGCFDCGHVYMDGIDITEQELEDGQENT